MALLLSSDLEGAVEFARIYEARIDAFGQHYRNCAQLTRKEVKARELQLRRATYQQVADWQDEGLDAVERARIAVAEIDEETGADQSSSNIPVPTPEPARPRDPLVPQPLSPQDALAAPTGPTTTSAIAPLQPPELELPS